MPWLPLRLSYCQRQLPLLIFRQLFGWPHAASAIDIRRH